MKLYEKALLCFALALAATGIAWGRAAVQDDIGAALAQPDGTRVTLFCESVLSVGTSGRSFAIEEWGIRRSGGPPRLVVVSVSQLPVREMWSCDATGVLGSVATKTGGTQRVLIVKPADVAVYCSPNGTPCPFTPFKLSGVDWPYKKSLLELAAGTQTSAVSVTDAGLPPIPDQPLDSEPSPPAAGSRDSLKWLPDGARVSVNGAIVSAAPVGLGFFYVERQDRSFGIRVSSQASVSDGDLVNVTGTMATAGGERCIVADTPNGVTVLESGYPRPIEIGVSNEMLGVRPTTARGRLELSVCGLVGSDSTSVLFV